MEKINPLAYLYHHLYLLQLEEYDLLRYWNILRKKWIPLHKRRKELVWTPKILLITTASLGIIAGTLLIYIRNPLFVFPVFLVSLFFSGVWISMALFFITFIDLFSKELVITRAQRKMATLTNLTVIGVAGSYGKTTMKEALRQVISQKFKTVATPGNINTPVGIARIVLNDITPQTEVFIVEMGEYQRGDIKHICSITKPQIGVITGINEAHLERMGTLAMTVATIFELAENMHESGLLVLNGDSALVRDNFKIYTRGQNIHIYSQKRPSQLKTQLLGEYAGALMDGVESVARRLGMTQEEVRIGAAGILPIEHRLQPIQGKHNMLIIDDSYNGNPDGVSEAVRVLARYTDRRKVYITPGLVEMGERSATVHRQIGRELAPIADLVVLVKNSVTPYIKEGLVKAKFNKKNILEYASSEEVYSHMTDFARPNDVILFQNDWPDNYV